MSGAVVESPVSAPSRAPFGSSDPGGDALILFSAGCFATVPILATWAYRSGAGILPLLAWRFVLAVTLLWLFLAFSRRISRVPSARLLGLLGMGLIYALMSSLYFLAVRLAPISTLTLIFYTYPALVTVLAALLLKERLTRLKLAALALALAGCILVLRPRAMGDWRGTAIAFLVSVVYSGYLLIGTRLMRELDPVLATTWILSATAVVFAATALGRREVLLPGELGAWGSMAGLAIIATVFSDVALFAGLPRTGASRAAILSTVEPPFTLLLSALFLGESIPPIRFLGGGLILGSVILLHREPAQ